MDEAFGKLAQSPNIGASYEQYGVGIRRHIFRSYLIFYSRTDTGILIERVLHSSRDIDTLYTEH